jgi:hypothetical protein
MSKEELFYEGMGAADELATLERLDTAGELSGPGRERLANVRIALAHETQSMDMARLADVAYQSTLAYEMGHRTHNRLNRASLVVQRLVRDLEAERAIRAELVKRIEKLEKGAN